MSEENQNKEKQNCLNCYFFYTVGESDQYDKKQVPDEIRKAIRNDWDCLFDAMKRLGLYSKLYPNLCCYHGVWSEKRDVKIKSSSKRKEYIIEKDRTNYCFFYKFTKEMNVEAAIELQKRQVEIEKVDNERKFQLKIVKEDRKIHQDETEVDRKSHAREAEKERRVLKLGIFLAFLIAWFSLYLRIIKSFGITLQIFVSILFIAIALWLGKKLSINKILFKSSKKEKEV